MISAATLSRARWHAGLEQLDDEPLASIAECLWKRNDLAACLRSATEDLLRVFEELNVELNGRQPSEQTGHEPLLPRSLVYAIAQILSLLRASREKTSDPAEVAAIVEELWQIETAWSAVLAGDIDDIRQHLEEELVASSR